jgi:hypothetical protein
VRFPPARNVPGVLCSGAHNFLFSAKTNGGKEGNFMKQEEKQPIPWEAKDPKPPIIHSGHLENKKQ